MIGSSVVPGLPNRCVMPSSLSSARKAERPVMRFFMSPPRPSCSLARGCRHHADCGSEINGGPSWLRCAGGRELLRYKAAKDREEIMTHACLAGIGLVLAVSLAAPSLAAPRDRFFWMAEINKASAVMVVERGIVPKSLAAKIFDAINR